MLITWSLEMEWQWKDFVCRLSVSRKLKVRTRELNYQLIIQTSPVFRIEEPKILESLDSCHIEL